MSDLNGSNYVQRVDDDLSSLAEGARASLVRIQNGHHGTGSGTVWHPQGLIVTNAHVVGTGRVQVTLADGRTLPARVLAHDHARDLAALAIDASDLATVQLGDSRSLRPGQWVLAMGHPWGVPGGATAGVVIGLGPAPAEATGSQQEWILLSLHLRPGHSGGPLLDAAGRLVGINTMINGPDVGLAVPVQEVKVFLRTALRA